MSCHIFLRFCVISCLTLFFGATGHNSTSSPTAWPHLAAALADYSQPPIVADAGFDRHASVGQAIQLDASRSAASSGSRLTYNWSAVKLPSGSKAKLSSANAVRPIFTVDVAGDYVFSLTVHSQYDGSSASALVTVSTVDVAPVANAGRNRAVTAGATVALDGSRSFDADGDPIFYQWTLVKKPRNSNAALAAPTSVRPSLTLDLPGWYLAELVVTDKFGKVSAPSRVVLSTQAGLWGNSSAGPAQFLPVGGSARIDADGTYLPSGAPASAAFTLIAAPTASKSVLTTGSDARANLQLDAAGDYVVQALIGSSGQSGGDGDDDRDNCGSLAPSLPATVLLTTGNVPPISIAGPEQSVAVGSTVTLDGSRTSDGNGDLLSYRWALLSVPAGSKATLDNAASVQPKFTADVAGTYVAQLIATDAYGDAPPSTVVVSTAGTAPIANAGPDPLAKSGASVLLDGSASRAPDGEAINANWTILGLGDQLTGSLSTPAALQTNFNAPVAGVPLNQAVLQGPAALPIVEYCEVSPVLQLAAAGALTNGNATYSIWRIRNPSPSAVGATLASVGSKFSLNVSVPARSDLFVASPVSTQHQLLVANKVVATINPASNVFSDTRLVGGGPPLELSIVQLIVTDNLLFDVDDVVVSTVEARPVAVLGATNPAYRGVAVTLDGRTSRNPNSGGTNTGLSYGWSLLSRPSSSKVTLSNATSSVAGFTPDVYGLYVAQLIVSDGLLNSRPKTIIVTVAPRPPVATATAQSPVVVGQLETLDGSASLDPDGNALTYSWSLTSVPSGSKATLGNTAAVKASFTPDIGGTYVAQLVVMDAYGVSSPSTVTIVAQSGLAFTPLPAQSVALGSRLNFTVVAKDPLGNPVNYSLAGALPTGATFDAASGAFSFRPTSNTPSTYNFTFQATNGKTLATLTVPVTVTGTPVGSQAGLTTQVYDATNYANGVLTPVAGVVVSSGALAGPATPPAR